MMNYDFHKTELNQNSSRFIHATQRTHQLDQNKENISSAAQVDVQVEQLSLTYGNEKPTENGRTQFQSPPKEQHYLHRIASNAAKHC